MDIDDLHAALHYRCRRADRCADWEWVDIIDPDGTAGRARIGRAINTTDGLCPTCTRHVEAALLSLPRDYVELALITGAVGGTSIEEPVSRSRELPIPLRLGVVTDMEAMVTEATCLAEAVAERLRVEWDSTLVDHHTRPAVALYRATHLLAGALSVLLAVRDWSRMVWAPDGWTAVPETRDGVDGALTCLDLHAHSRRLVGRSRLVHRLPAGCPRCERRGLVRESGDDTVSCTRCGRRYTGQEYETLVCALAASTPA